MDTRLKKGKKIRSFIYRIVAAGAFFAMIGTGILGREALINMHNEGTGTLSGNVYYLTEFREYVAYLYNQGMLGYAGIGDDNGYPLTDERSVKLAEEAKRDFSSDTRLTGSHLLYYIECNGQIMDSNISFPLFSEYDGHLLLPEDTTLCCYWDGSTGRLQFFSRTYKAPLNSSLEEYYAPQYSPNMERIGNVKLLLALKNNLSHDSVYTSYMNRLANQAWRYHNLLIAFIVSAGILVISWLGCLFTFKAGKQAKADYLRMISKVWLELRLLITAGMLYICTTLHLWDFGDILNHRLTFSGNWGFYFPMGILLYLLYIDFKGHGVSILKQTFIYHLYRLFRRYQASLPWLRKALNMYHISLLSSLLLLVTGGVTAFIVLQSGLFYSIPLTLPLSLLSPLAGIALLAASLRLKKFVNDTAAINDKLTAISSGNAGVPLTLAANSLLTQAADNLNAVGNGIVAAVEQNNRSNKMRVELITNVSHDLKTPLTSIINYADLLCEEDLPEQAATYAQSLRDKSYRLKSMVQDVFDLSKATSGNLNVEKTRLDLAKLIRQTLADMDERITESNLIFKLNIVSEPLFIEADGEKLYRVFQNLIINALQYSLEHSRVHVVLEEQNGRAYARLKNISRQELNFTADEIMERFVRADSSRTTEGSGLGLSIVQSFTEACGGIFTIEMDADLFTACVSFPLIPIITESEETHEETT